MQHIRPAFRVTANGADITGTITPRYISLKLTDEAGLQSDALEITLADTDPNDRLRKPPKGAELEVWLGYDDQAKRMGLFVADEIEMSGWPGQMVIRAKAATFEKSKGGKTDLQTQKTRNWAKGTKLSAMVAKIAKEHGMEPAVAKSLQSVTLPHFDQTEESDISFLVRVLKRFDAIVKPGGGKLAVAKRGESKTASGDAMPTVTLAETDCTKWQETESAREENGTVVAFYHDRHAAKRQETKMGSGDPVRRLRHNYPDKAAAEKAAQAELDRRGRTKNKFTCTMPGNPDLAAEAKLKLSGFHPDLTTDWLVTRVVHDISPTGGYTCEVEAELPKGDDKA
jgi:phage protein D